MIWRCRDHRLDLADRGRVMGILNTTPDSFSDGGEFIDPDRAVERALSMVEEGAEIIDIGGESTRPGAEPVNAEAESARVLPVIERLAPAAAERGFLISIDTTKAEVARQACILGAHIINDISGLRAEPDIANVAAEFGAGVVVMHMKGEPRTMQADPVYADIVHEVREFFQAQLDFARSAGIDPDQVVFDPGFGFGKTLDHNLQLLAALDRLSIENRPLLAGISRKSMFGKLLGAEVGDRLWPTVATTAYARGAGARIHRVHDVRPNVEALKTIEAILKHRI
ncbi:MAG: dihydropteroate synthase [Verrucomicrobiales bacterium]|jgi:dihydropteroate synthase